MIDDVSFEFLEVRNVAPEYVDDLISQHLRDGWQVINESEMEGQEGLKGKPARAVFFKREMKPAALPLHP